MFFGVLFILFMIALVCILSLYFENVSLHQKLRQCNQYSEMSISNFDYLVKKYKLKYSDYVVENVRDILDVVHRQTSE